MVVRTELEKIRSLQTMLLVNLCIYMQNKTHRGVLFTPKKGRGEILSFTTWIEPFWKLLGRHGRELEGVEKRLGFDW